MRLDRFIASQREELSRSKVKELCRRGLVTVNGAVVKSSDFSVDEQSDEVCISGERIGYREHVYIMLNKPAGVVCATKDRLTETVLELIPPELRRRGLFPAGRLDKDTEGFVLITDDGELAHRMLSPRSHVPKTYFVRLETPVSEDTAARFSAGITIDGGELCLPAELTFTDVPNECLLVLHEGKFHQVKRMFAAVGNRVTYLKRVRIGALELDEKLPLGACLEIMHKDVDKLLTRQSPD
ncbi:MAG: rRNA pseudouridine synthase [Ruminococcus sp.]|nr:rRNA pseudouridine synthase [Ruminococcus sp.]